jgi:DmsE family decaheme c-type cytochrome
MVNRQTQPFLKAIVVSCLLALLSAFLVANGASAELQYTSACMDCHEGIDTLLTETAHRIQVSPGGERIANFPSSCADCHSGWEAHLEQPELGTIHNPGKENPFENLKLCTSCHSSPHSQESVELGVHFRNGVGCSTCHSVHHPKEEYLLVSSPNDLCLGCHQDVSGKFFLVSRHPVIQKTILCIDCHKLSEPLDEPLSASNVNLECFSCHAEYQGPFPYEHGAVNDYTVDKEGCIYCHDPHGSPNPRLLKQPVRSLCLQCHFVPKHRTVHQGVWAKRDCLECHTDVHGSYTDKNLLGEDIFGGSCFVYGCHVH